ncbi:MAG: hypothetical protein JNL88_07965 [Bacteroidia bacterium]|nr:hypothetical protein [Bacteroidia bacterium]
MPPHQNEIPLEDAIVLTQRYKANHAGGTIRAFQFDASVISTLMEQANASGFRAYLGEEPDKSLVLILVATNENLQDLTGVVMNHGRRCPNTCDETSPL